MNLGVGVQAFLFELGVQVPNTQRKMANHSVQVIYLHNKTDHKLSVLYYQQESIWMRLVAVAVLSKCVLPSG